ncbi:MAG: hypothetical protein RBR86_01585 [Pseudobdellovibrionaceae bacterium]|jgi:hypothetical protein|nr:hypothetical protein [Pseudobdellovibrionaceae bacterium]
MGGRAFIIGKDRDGALNMNVVPRDLYDNKMSITNAASTPAEPRHDFGLNISGPAAPQP